MAKNTDSTIAALFASTATQWDVLVSDYQTARDDYDAYRKRIFEPLEQRAGEVQHRVLAGCKGATRAMLLTDVPAITHIAETLVPGYAAARDGLDPLLTRVDETMKALLSHPAPDVAALRRKLEIVAEGALELDPDDGFTRQVVADIAALLPKEA